MQQEIKLLGEKMTVAQLIEKLAHFPPKASVVVRGYEDGFDSVRSVTEKEVAWQANKGHMDCPVTGEHEEPACCNKEVKTRQVVLID